MPSSFEIKTRHSLSVGCVRLNGSAITPLLYQKIGNDLNRSDAQMKGESSFLKLGGCTSLMFMLG